MDVEWRVALPAVGRWDVMPTRTDDATFRQQLDLLLDQESGYLEVSLVGSAYPLLTFSKSAELGVVHRFDDAETCLLLQGEGQVPEADVFDFPIEDEVAAFTGEFVSAAHRAASVLQGFVEGSDVARLGQWFRL
jgi:hypothetical protein